ncbi:MAG: prepilin-type N-terminal cleavage/methylation domain-containing protein [Verrucomicrobia bacterium]|nr:prepilin-type N-terminal cleavage/methylation domain-containing protein [Verrucomicrobiota bacterium]
MKHNSISFTLIELLVVIAIISILASLLLPSLKRTRDLGKQTLCVGNLKQLIAALHMYADDYDDRIPVANQDAAPAYVIPSDYPPEWYQGTWYVVIWPYMKSRAGMLCPNGDFKGISQLPPVSGHYGCNSPGVFGTPPTWGGTPKRRDSITDPSHIYALFDFGLTMGWQPYALSNASLWNGYTPGAPWNTGPSNYDTDGSDWSKKRHPGGVCVAFLDGHVHVIDVVHFSTNSAAWN